MASGARFTATFDLRFVDQGAAGYLTALRKTETAQAKVAAATKRAAAVGVSAAKATGTQAKAATGAATATDSLAAAQTRASVATRTQAAALAAQSTALFKQAAAITVVDDATGKLHRQTLAAAKSSASAAAALGAQDVAARKAATGTLALGRAGRDADKAFLGAAGRVGDFAKRAAGLGAIVLGGGLALGLASGVKAAANFDTALREVGAVSDTSGEKLQALGKIARQAGLETGVGASEATKAMGELAKAGVAAADIGPALKGTLQLAQAGGLDAAAAAEAAANAMSSFGLQGSKATKVADAYANAANMTTADVGDFALAMSQGSSAAKTAGLSFEDTTLALTLLARNAVKGSDAGTSLKAAITQLAKPTAESQAAMDKYNLSFFDARGNMRSVSDIAGMLNTKLGGLTREQKLATLTTLAGTDGQRALGALMGVTRSQADKLRDSLTKQGSAAKTAQAKQGGYAGAMDRLKASFEEVKIAVGTPLLGALSKAADAVSKLVNGMSKAGTFAKVGRGVGDFIKGLGGKTPTATSQVVRTGGQARTERVAAPAPSGAMKVGSAISSAVSGAAKAAGDAFAKLRPQLQGFIKDVGPAWQNIIKPFLQGFGQGLLSTAKVVVTVGVAAFRVLGKVLGGLGSIAGKLGLDKVFRAVGTVISWFAGGPIAKAIGAVIKGTKTFGRLSSIVRLVAAPFRAAGSAAMKVGSTLLKVAGWVADKATMPYRLLGRVVFGMGKTVAGVVVSAASAVGRFASRVGSSIGKAIDWFRRLPGRALDAVKGLGSKLGGLVGSIASGAAKIGKGIVDGIVNAIKAAPGAILSAIGSIIPGKLKSAANSILGTDFHKGGKVRGYFTGGQVAPVNLASGELLAFPGGGSAMVPGGVSARDNVSTAVPVGTRVFTTHGQDLMAGGMSPTAALARQMPNGYVGGGIVEAAKAGRAAGWTGSKLVTGVAIAGPESGYRNDRSLVTSAEDSRGMWQINTKAHTWAKRLNLRNPYVSAKAAERVRANAPNGWGQWTGYTGPDGKGSDGAWRDYLDRARKAVVQTRSGSKSSGSSGGGSSSSSGGTETVIKKYPTVKMRGGLLEAGAAARAGYDQALAGDSFASRKKYGDPFLTDLRGAYTEANRSRMTERDKPDSVTAASATPKGGGRIPDGVGKTTRLGRMIGMANAIDSKRYQYAWGGGHGRLGVPSRGSLHAHGRGPVGLGFDCSGAVSAVLGAGKLLTRPLTSGALMGWGRKGSSKNLRVQTDPGHVIMRLRNRWFGTSGQNPKGGAGWLTGNTMGARGVSRTWPGLRRGGRARGYVAGGTVGRFVGRRAVGTAGLTPRLRSRILTQGFDKLDDTIGRLANARLAALYKDIAKLAAKGGSPKTVNRLRATMDLIERRVGYRIGRIALAAQKVQQGMDARATFADQSLRVNGIDAASASGVWVAQQTNMADQADIAMQRRQVSKAITAAKRLGPAGKDILTELRGRLTELRDAAAEAAVRQVELAREAVMAATAERSDAAQRVTDNVSASLAFNEAAQRVAGTTDTAAGMAQRAAMQQALAPALQAQAEVERQNAAAYSSIGRTTEAQDALARAAQLTTDALNAMADSADLARAAQMKVVTDRLDASGFDKSIADVIGDRQQLNARLAGVSDAAMASQRADYFATTLRPLLERQAADLQNAVNVAASQGDNDAVRQYRLELEQKRNELLEAQLQVQEDIKANTANRSFGGSLAYEFGGGVYTDLVLDGNGA